MKETTNNKRFSSDVLTLVKTANLLKGSEKWKSLALFIASYVSQDSDVFKTHTVVVDKGGYTKLDVGFKLPKRISKVITEKTRGIVYCTTDDFRVTIDVSKSFILDNVVSEVVDVLLDFTGFESFLIKGKGKGNGDDKFHIQTTIAPIVDNELTDFSKFIHDLLIILIDYDYGDFFDSINNQFGFLLSFNQRFSVNRRVVDTSPKLTSEDIKRLVSEAQLNPYRVVTKGN